MNSAIATLIRALLIFLFAGSLLIQFLLPNGAHEMAGDMTEVQHLIWPFAIIGILAIICFQVVLGTIWHLLTLTVHGSVFSGASLRSATIIVIACAAATFLASYPFFHMTFVLRLGGPGFVLGLIGVGAVGTTITLLMLTLRTILKAATSNRLELDEVI
ncbi:DUF2975 domain-containing protein [Jonesiaceae bacterium BS-20]|uniref:DUF2975 domain-containing protein n=1 Tax=Jonesiaceae bacterium BS-20 TaxID=3120821 RepID=A0AAU7DU48_9MICO